MKLGNQISQRTNSTLEQTRIFMTGTEATLLLVAMLNDCSVVLGNNYFGTNGEKITDVRTLGTKLSVCFILAISIKSKRMCVIASWRYNECVGGMAQLHVQSCSDPWLLPLAFPEEKQWAQPNTRQTQIENKAFLISDLSGAQASSVVWCFM